MKIAGHNFSTMRTAVITAVVGFFIAHPVLAQNVNVGLEQAASIGLTTTDIRTLIGNIIRYFLGLLGIIAVALMMYAGFTWMTAGGNEEKIQKAKQILASAAIGLFIIMSAYAIVHFVLRAITGATGTGGLDGPGGCPAGQTCSFGTGGGAGGFVITGIIPAGPGPGDRGWPKNYALSVSFNAEVSAASVADANSVVVRKCNARLSGAAPQPFDDSACGTPVSGTRTAEGNRVVFKPDATPGDDATDFESDFWYSIRVQGGAIRDLLGRPLVCPFNPVGPTGDISSPSAQRNLCDRAAAFNDQRDVAPPTVYVDSPKSPPAYCISPGFLPVPVHATAQDDFLVASVDFLLDGGTANLIDAETLDPSYTSVNADLSVPSFSTSSVLADLSLLAEGPHRITAVARDGVPQSSSPAEASFTLNPPHCCDATQNEGETGMDCGGVCGSCAGQTCTDDAQCASGFCDATGHCADKPIIDSISPLAAGPGSLVTVRGRFFGANPGTVTFLGGDGADDDVVANPCAPDAWDAGQVVIAVPAGAVTGPIRLTTSAGQTDDSDDNERGPNIGAFTVNGAVLPGICFINPSAGLPGSQFAVNGNGFGATIGTSAVRMGSFAPTVATGGWTESRVTLVVPPAPQRAYPVSVTVGGVESNSVNFTVGGLGAASTPRVVSVSPTSGPRDSYVTVQGTGFGRLKGTVRFSSALTPDVAIAEDPICADNWHENYVIVKVPRLYGDGSNVAYGDLPGVAHTVQVVPPAPYDPSNDDVVFRITNESPRPGICAVIPDNGRPGKTVQLIGEGFGNPAGAQGPASAPRYSVDFFKGGTDTVSSTAYSVWQPGNIGTVVAGTFADESTWPVSGPVGVTSDNEPSSNTIPFTIGDCNASGAACATGTSCCANGSCQTSCEPEPRISAYGWLFSTSVLPSFPIVIENALCRAQPTPAILQSPSPYKGSTDACKNAEIRVEFDRALDLNGVAAAVDLQECGNGPTAGACGAEIANLRFTPHDCGTASAAMHCRVLAFTPPANYNAGTSYLKESTWYRVTLDSDPQAGTGLREPGTDGTYLDGNFNRQQGGDYVFSFKTRAGNDTCALSSVFVDPPKNTIDQDEYPVDFYAVPTAANCNSLQCEDPLPYSVAWVVDQTYFRPLIGSTLCTQPIRALEEIALTPVRATMTPIGTTLSRSGTSEVTIRFAEPRVIEVSPAAACVEACINADIVATFNVPMDPASLTRPGNVVLQKCRNASCTAPFLPLVPTIRTAEAAPTTSVTGYASEYRHVSITGSGTAANFEPSTFYRVSIRGGANGVTSRSGALLGGLNDGEWYAWTFRTKDDDTACLASRSSIAPAFSTLYYIGQRQDLFVTPFGSPDECSASGQKLLPSAFSWDWSFDDPNLVLAGFKDGNAATPTSETSVVNTNAVPPPGCTDRCLLRGSQIAVPQCNNGTLEAQYEECDTPGAGCSARCTFSGTSAPTCGNGITEAGENCESVSGIFPAGCKQPGTQAAGFADAVGCVLTGSSTAINSRCGDGFIGDGEACDDRNAANGDGCSADCLKEGTLPSCVGASAGAECVNFCGNGVAEVGEDATCEPNPSARGCDVATCLKKGSQKCGAGQTANCCGNDVVDPGEDQRCETSPNGDAFCTENCLLKGSSVFHMPGPSFCGDNVVGPGEAAQCEGRQPDDNIDPYQLVVASTQPGFDAQSTAGSSTLVRATTAGIASGEEGTSNISLSCTCNSHPADQRDAFCASFDVNAGLACATNGCCAPRPQVTTVLPTVNGACRNAAIAVSFDQVMESGSLQRAVLVGYDNGSAACPAGTTRIEFTDGGSLAETSLFRRIADAVVDFFRTYILRPVFGAAAGSPDSGNVFCAVPASVTVTHEGSPEPTVSVAHVALKNALPADRWIVVRVSPEAKSALGVAVDPNGYRSYFGTGKDVCTVERVTVTPPSALFSAANSLTSASTIALTAHAFTKTQEEIVPTTEYPWSWSWTEQPASEPSVSPIVLEPRSDEEGALSFADARVRGSRTDDSPSGYTPRNGQATAEATAIIGIGPTAIRRSGSSGITVFLCDNPWPARIEAGSDRELPIPWDASPPWQGYAYFEPGAAYWFPFYDRTTNFSFYYCRDGQGVGDVAPTLPALRVPPAVVTPGRDIIKEYLFTYDTSVPPPPTTGSTWTKDAIGFRISLNPTHLGPLDWYVAKGFKGAPSPLKVDEFDAIRDGRTVYVDAASLPDFGGRIYTNINVFSYNDGASPETVSIFNQILGNVDFMSYAGISYADGATCSGGQYGSIKCNSDADCKVNDAGSTTTGFDGYTCDAPRGVCMNAQGQDDPDAGIAISCSADVDCQKGADGQFILNGSSLARGGANCEAPKLKLSRDVRRWADLQGMRKTLTAKAAAGTAPKLEAGTFLSTISVTAWPSWSETLSTDAGRALPKDPVNLFGFCQSTNFSEGAVTNDRKADTCWNDKDRSYFCAPDSHVYEYRYFQDLTGQNFRLRADFEFPTLGFYSTSWGGATCIEKNSAACAADPECVFENGQCNYKVGKLYVGGVNQGPNCAGAIDSEGNVCGDGRVGPNELCEPSQERSISCGTNGQQAQVCASNCQSWTSVGSCTIGTCGDGIIRGAEVCDEGTLNGQYGHCAADCRSFGMRCGDGARQPAERCDCGDRNGQYFFNGVIGVHVVTATLGGSSGTFGASINGTRVTVPYQSSTAVTATNLTNAINNNSTINAFASAISFGSVVTISALTSNTTLTVTNGGTSGGNAQVTVATVSNSCTAAASSASHASCAWDCSGAGPRCGDGVVNNTERCDGDVELFRGYCSDSARTGCDTDADCPGSATCGNFCSTVEQLRRRTCKTNNAASTTDDQSGEACTWNAWTCTAPGSCGNGVTETGEACDDGNDDNTDGCLTTCKAASCGDNFVNASAGEQCDNGSDNNARCVPEYGRTCSYCSAACKLLSVSGGFCGDSTLQNATASPKGPEECDGSLGSLNEYICVSTLPETQSYGLRTGTSGATTSVCSANSCVRTCAQPDSAVCRQVGCDWQTVSENHDYHAQSPTYNPDNYWIDNAYVNPVYDAYGVRASLCDACDPDDDDDGVPDTNPAECGQFNYNQHGAYRLDFVDLEGDAKTIDIPVATEVCTDSVDNDCDGFRNERAKVSGKVIDVQTGGALVGAKVVLYCDDVEVAEDASLAANGAYSIDLEYDGSKCAGADDWIVKVEYGSELCGETELDYNYSSTSCFDRSDVDFELTKNPPPGTVRATVQWETDVDLDFHAYAVHSGEDTLHLYHGDKSITDNGKQYSLDLDDQGTLPAGSTNTDTYGFYNPGGLETITIPRRAGSTYHFAVHNYDGTGNWKDFGLKMRIYYDNCKSYKPETYDDWPEFLDSTSLDWLAFLMANKVDAPLPEDAGGGSCNDRYDYCCIDNTESNPCAALCTAATNGDGYPTCVAPKKER